MSSVPEVILCSRILGVCSIHDSWREGEKGVLVGRHRGIEASSGNSMAGLRVRFLMMMVKLTAAGCGQAMNNTYSERSKRIC